MFWRGRRSSKAGRPAPATTCVIFTTSESRLRAMDVAAGPCVPLPGRKTSIVSVHRQQGPETPEQMRELFPLLGGSADQKATALELIEAKGAGELYRCSDEFVRLMVARNLEHLQQGDIDRANGDDDLPRFAAAVNDLDARWLASGNWHSSMVGTGNRLIRIAWARVAIEKRQSLYSWYGPPVAEYVIMSGTGPYPGKVT